MVTAMDIILILCIFLLAGAVKGLSGLGLPTVAMALLGMRLAPAEAAALLVVPSLLTNVWQAWAGPQAVALVRRFWPLLVGLVAGTGLGGWLAVDGAIARLVLAEVLMLYAMLGLLDFKMRVPVRAEPVAAPLVGLGTGLLAAVTGIFVIPLVPYLQSLSLRRDTLIQTMGLSFVVATLAMAALLAGRGSLAGPQVSLSLLAAVPALMGMVLGGRLRHRISQQVFRRGFFCLLFAVGVHLLLG